MVSSEAVTERPTATTPAPAPTKAGVKIALALIGLVQTLATAGLGYWVSQGDEGNKQIAAYTAAQQTKANEALWDRLNEIQTRSVANETDIKWLKRDFDGAGATRSEPLVEIVEPPEPVLEMTPAHHEVILPIDAGVAVASAEPAPPPAPTAKAFKPPKPSRREVEAAYREQSKIDL